MRYHVQGVSESIRFEILTGAREEPAEERVTPLCDERICQAASAIARQPWAWPLEAVVKPAPAKD